MSYLETEVAPKERTGSPDIERGSIKLEHLSAELFLELKNIALHTHQGVVSNTLPRVATPYMLKGFIPGERVESTTVTWTGGAASTGSLVVTFNVEFQTTPTVVVVPTGEADATLRVSLGAVSTTGVTIYWAKSAGTDTSIDFDIIVIGK